MQAAPLVKLESYGRLNDMYAPQGRAYDPSRYQTSPCLRAKPLEHHKNDGYTHGGNLHTDGADLYHFCDSSVQQRRIRDIVHRGLQQDLSHILACLADALTTTGQCGGQDVPSHTRVAQLLSEVHHIQRMKHRASKMSHGPWVCSTYEDSVTSVSSPPLQNSGRSVPSLGVGADAPASQTQLTPRQQMGRTLQMAGEQPSCEGDVEHAWGMVTARLHRPHAPNPSSVESNHNIQRPPDQRPALAVRSSKQDMPPVDTGVTVQHSPKRLEATSTSTAMSGGTSGKSAKRPHVGHDAPVVCQGHTAGAHQQRSNRRTSASVNTLSQLSASHLTHVPGHSDDQGSKSTSAGVVAPHRSATLTRPGVSKPAWDDSVVTPASRGDRTIRAEPDIPLPELPARHWQLQALHQPKSQHPWLSRRATALRNTRASHILSGPSNIGRAPVHGRAGHNSRRLGKTEHEGRAALAAAHTSARKQSAVPSRDFLRQLDGVQSSMHRMTDVLERCLGRGPSPQPV